MKSSDRTLGLKIVRKGPKIENMGEFSGRVNSWYGYISASSLVKQINRKTLLGGQIPSWAAML